MPLPASIDRDLMHNRDIDCRGYRRSDGLWDIEAHIVDTKPYSYDDPLGKKVEAGRPVHAMWLRITIDEELLIHDAVAASDETPYATCQLAAPNFARLKGVRIGPGWWQEVRQRVGGKAGCTHIVELLRPMATTAYQTLTALEPYDGSVDPERRPQWLDTCYAHAADSPVTAKLFPAFYTGSFPIAQNGIDPAPRKNPESTK
jgi:hypothetical protein